MLVAVMLSGIVTSTLLLLLGLGSMQTRYGLAVVSAYVVFAALVGLWLRCVRRGMAVAPGTPSERGSSGSSIGGTWGISPRCAKAITENRLSVAYAPVIERWAGGDPRSDDRPGRALWAGGGSTSIAQPTSRRSPSQPGHAVRALRRRPCES